MEKLGQDCTQLLHADQPAPGQQTNGIASIIEK
jgi:hypothetical protein